MANLKKIKAQIENANALGVANLTRKGVELPSDATTYEIMHNISRLGNASEEAETAVNADGFVSNIILPVTVPAVTAEINNNSVADSSASMEG